MKELPGTQYYFFNIGLSCNNIYLAVIGAGFTNRPIYIVDKMEKEWIKWKKIQIH